MKTTNCSVHERCIWELTLEGAKANADVAIRRMEAAEICAAQLESKLAVAVEALEKISKPGYGLDVIDSDEYRGTYWEEVASNRSVCAREALSKIRGES